MADNAPDISLNQADITADNTPDISLHSADSTEDSDICPADDRQNTDNFEKISILELQKKYGIGRDAFYGRTRYLRITTWKIGKKGYLDAEQIMHMDGLHDHIQATGKMEGFPIPEPSGPIEVEDEQPATTTTTLAVAETQQIATPDYAPQEKRSHSTQVDDVMALVKSAQNKAAGLMIAENLLARQYLEAPELLPDELKQKIKESGEMPTIDPFAYANSLIGLANLPGVAV